MVVRGRLWRLNNPALSEEDRQSLVSELMNDRRAVRDAKGDVEAMRVARQRVDAAKVRLGERGPVWWDDGAPDYNRKMAVNTPYGEWFVKLQADTD